MRAACRALAAACLLACYVAASAQAAPDAAAVRFAQPVADITQQAATRTADARTAGARTNASFAAEMPPGECRVSFLPPGTRLQVATRYEVNVRSGGLDRTFTLVLPRAFYETDAEAPVMLAVHGAFQSATIFLNANGSVAQQLHSQPGTCVSRCS
jgi:hypothetical protein